MSSRPLRDDVRDLLTLKGIHIDVHYSSKALDDPLDLIEALANIIVENHYHGKQDYLVPERKW